MNDRKTAVIYARTNTRMGSPGDSIADQEKVCRDAAEAGGYEVVQVFQEYAGGNSGQRPTFQKMLAYLGEHFEEAPTVFIQQPNRLARDSELFYKFVETIVAHGGQVQCVERMQEKALRIRRIEIERD